MCLWGGHTHVHLRNCGRRSIFAFRHCDQLCTPQRLSHSASVCVRVSVCVCVCAKNWLGSSVTWPHHHDHSCCVQNFALAHTHTYTALINQCQMCVLHFALHLWVFYSWKLLRTRKYAQNLKPFLDLERIRNAILWILWKWLSTLFLLDLLFYVKRLF